MNLTLGPIVDNGPIDTEPSLELDNGHGFPDALFVIAVGEGQFCFTYFTLTGPDKDPITASGLNVWADIEDARNCAALIEGGAAVEKTLYECRRIVEFKGQSVDSTIKAIALMKGQKIIDVLWVRA